MELDVIIEIRKGLKEELEGYDEGPVRLRVESEIAEAILFNVDEDEKKTFAFSNDLMKKIDFSGISFDGFDCNGFDFSQYKGVTLDPQKVYNRDLRNAKLKGVTIINTFDDVLLDGVDSTGMNYKTFEKKFENARSK